jgi:alkylated DNA nucleotide flippase Atl1
MTRVCRSDEGVVSAYAMLWCVEHTPYVEQVLAVVETIPPGRVMSYGDIAEYVGEGGPRQVGRVMSEFGGGVPWWRVIRADGSPPTGHERECLQHLREEAAPLRPGGQRVDMRRGRWDGRHRPR